MYDEKGAPITKSVTAVSKAVCQEKLEELKVKCGVVTGRAKSDMPFGEWIDLWYQTWSKPGLRITTQQCYEDRIYNHIIPHVDKIPLNKLTQSDLQQFYAELKRNGRRIRRDLYGPGLSDRMVSEDEKGAGAGAVQGHPLPRSAPHLRHDRLGARHGRENALRHHRPHLVGYDD